MAVRTPFGFHSTGAEVLAGADLSGTSAVVTGAASGIGIETARVLAGAAVTLAVRDGTKGREVAADITKSPETAVSMSAHWSWPTRQNAGVTALPEREQSTPRTPTASGTPHSTSSAVDHPPNVWSPSNGRLCAGKRAEVTRDSAERGLPVRPP